ncbi:MAG TPA: DUF3267 domain-containing protein [Ruminococcus sp.]|nr:DUF3267 domain-containing protein [Ruminococcus sp.]
MPKIIWEGNRKNFGTAHKSPPLPENAVKLRDADGFLSKALPYGIPPMLLCMLTVFLKAFLNRQPPIAPLFLIPAMLIGFLLALPLHELLHAVCYPKAATVWVGLCLRKFAAYAISYHPLTKRRFVVMSLAPAVSGVIPLVLFICTPVTMKPLLTVWIICAFMGLISPAPDYMDVVSVLKNVPPHALICDTQDGLYWYPPQNTGKAARFERESAQTNDI